MSKKLGFIGAGNMATAILNGVLSTKFVQSNDVYAFDLSTEKCEEFSNKGVNICKTGNDVVKSSDFIVLAVKPQNYEIVLSGIKDAVTDEKILISIAAGISIDYIRKALSKNAKVVRVMPNTPLLVEKGASALCPSDNIDKSDFDFVYKLFSLSGVAEVLPESQMNEIIAVNGSSPAYIYLFAKAMLSYAKECNIDEKAALGLITATLEGSAKMIKESEDDIDTLIKKVSSPGGTTLAALDVLYKNNFSETVIDAMRACTNRAEELGK